MAKKVTDDCRRMEIRQMLKGEVRTVLRWEDQAGNLEARAMLTREGEAVDVASRGQTYAGRSSAR